MTRFSFKDDNGTIFVANLFANGEMSILAIDTDGHQFTLVYPEGDMLSTFAFNHPSGKQLVFDAGSLPNVWDRAASHFGIVLA